MPMNDLYDQTCDSAHWLTRYDPDDGEPYGVVCRCNIGSDHDGSGKLTDN